MKVTIMNQPINNKSFFNGIFSTLILITSLTTSLTLSVTASANTHAEPEKISASFSDVKKNISSQMRTQIQAKLKAPSRLTTDNAVRFSGKTRTEIQAMNRLASKANSNNDKSAKQLAAGNTLPDFSIYRATSYWQDDYDYDGYNQTFSITFDADLYSYDYNQIAEVYAVLYLSRNGGDWVEYHTTNNFIIESDLNTDEYEVITTLVSGYPPGDYDVLIDLYTAGYSEIVATYSSDDSNALYALPLESANFDEPYVEVIEVHDAGSMSMWLVLLLLAISYRRLLKMES